MASRRYGPDYEQLGANAASYMTAPVYLGPEVRGKITALGSGTRNPTGGIPIYMDPRESGVDYIADESSLRAKTSRPLPLTIEEGHEYAAYTPERDDTDAVLDAIRRDNEAMKSSEFSREVSVIPVKEMSVPGVGTKIRASDFSRADVFRPMPADVTDQKKRDGPSIRFVHFSDAPVDKPYAAV